MTSRLALLYEYAQLVSENKIPEPVIGSRTYINKYVKPMIAVTTFTYEKTDPRRYDIIQRSLESLKQTATIPVFIIVDGCTERHKQILESYRSTFTLVYRMVNGGISRAKNTCIETLLDAGCDLLYLADDDVIYNHGWDSFYQTNIENTGIQSVYFVPQKSRPAARVKDNILIPGGCFGCLMVFSKIVVDTIGYFPVLPSKYGYEHHIYSDLCVKYKLVDGYADFVDSDKYIRLDEESSQVKSCDLMDDEFNCHKNERLYILNHEISVPIEKKT